MLRLKYLVGIADDDVAYPKRCLPSAVPDGFIGVL